MTKKSQKLGARGVTTQQQDDLPTWNKKGYQLGVRGAANQDQKEF